MSLIKSKIFLSLLVFALVLVVVFFIRNSSSGSQNIAVGEPNPNGNQAKGINLEDLSKHNKLEDCWVSYNGKVYDLTSWLPNHPGRPERILPYCGTSEEFKNAFEQKHGTTKAKLLTQVGTFMGDLQVVGKLN